MDRVFFYPGELLQDTDLLNLQKNAMIGIGAALEMMLGQNTIACGFSCSALSNTAVSGSAFAVSISRGFLSSYQEVDPNAYGTLGTDASRNVMKCGVNLSATTLGLTNAAPTTAGQSINYLISAAFSESDGQEAVLPYVNAANPAQPFSGQSNSGTAQNTVRAQAVVFEATAGTAATTGSQTTPAPPAGYVPLFVVTVTNGETAVAGGNISQAPAAPIIPYNLQQLTPGFSNVVTITNTGSWTVPAGVTKIKVTAIGGGAAGAGTGVTGSTEYGAGAGGSGGAEAIGIFEVTPFEVFAITIGVGGSGVAGASGQDGGNTTFGSLMTAVGGSGGYYQAPAVPPFVCPSGNNGTQSSGGYINAYTRCGGPGLGMGGSNVSGHGGSSLVGGGASGIQGPGAGSFGFAYGTGGSGACVPPNTATAYAGGGGKDGVVFIEY